MGIPRRGGVPNGIRTRVSALKGLDPRPLDDGDATGRIVTPPDGPSIKAGLVRRHETFQYTPPDAPGAIAVSTSAHPHTRAHSASSAAVCAGRHVGTCARGRTSDRRRNVVPHASETGEKADRETDADPGSLASSAGAVAGAGQRIRIDADAAIRCNPAMTRATANIHSAVPGSTGTALQRGTSFSIASRPNAVS